MSTLQAIGLVFVTVALGGIVGMWYWIRRNSHRGHR